MKERAAWVSAQHAADSEKHKGWLGVQCKNTLGRVGRGRKGVAHLSKGIHHSRPHDGVIGLQVVVVACEPGGSGVG